MSVDRLSSLWCALAHPAPMWPIHGRYRCRQCLREYPVPWQTLEAAAQPVLPPRPLTRIAALQSD
jgi:hypothetical protein